MKFRTLILVGALLVSPLFIPQYSNAVTLTYDLSVLVTGLPIPPTWTPPPYARATFTDEPGGVVRLTMEALTMYPYDPPPPGNPHVYRVDEWYFNVASDWTGSGPGTDLGQLTPTYRADLSTAPAAQEVIRSLNNITVTGDGKFDWGLKWDPFVFDNGEVAVYDITYTGGKPFSALTFDNVSVTDPGHPVFHTVMKTRNESPQQYIGDGDPVAEPATMLLLGFGLIGLAGYGRMKFSN